MKHITSIILVLITVVTFGQREWNIGIEGQTSYLNTMEYNGAITRGGNIFLQFKEFEIYFGFNQKNTSSFSLRNQGYSVIGPSFGAKYHLYNNRRRGHFYTDLNVQFRKYYHYAGTPALGGNTDFNSWNPDNILLKLKSTNFQLNAGYEAFIIKRISIPVAMGVGFVKHKGNTSNLGTSYGYDDVNKIEFSPHFQIGIRFSLIKLEKPTANTTYM